MVLIEQKEANMFSLLIYLTPFVLINPKIYKDKIEKSKAFLITNRRHQQQKKRRFFLSMDFISDFECLFSLMLAMTWTS